MSSSTVTDEFGSTMPSSREILLFGDLTTEFEDDLRELLQDRAHAGLQQFISHCGKALQTELSRLPTEEQNSFPPFTDILDLVTRKSGCFGNAALQSALLCLYQLGRILRSPRPYPTSSTSVAIGVCTGSFAAAAVAGSNTFSQLSTNGVHAFLTAFRVGYDAFRMRLTLDGDQQASDARPWSVIVSLSVTKAEEIINRFSNEKVTSVTSRPYISAVSPSTVTISGPPRSLERFVKSFALKAHPISIFSPYHAGHLYPSSSVEVLLPSVSSIENLSPAVVERMSLISASTGELETGRTLQDLLKSAIRDTLLERVQWPEVFAESSSMRDLCLNEDVVVYPVGCNKNVASFICSGLQTTGAKSSSVSSFFANKISQPTKASETSQNCKIAIVGFSGRYPEAPSNEEFWKVLLAARDCHRNIPSDRFDWESHFDPTGKKKNTSRVKHGCFINEPGVFDARFFNLSPREAENADPAQRLALMSAYEALEMAGFVPDRTPSTRRDRVGVFMGVTSDDWREVNSGQDVDTYFIPGGNRAFHAGRISFFFRFSGPSISVDTACSSSFAAISTACGYLRAGDCDSAIAGGTNVLTNPDNFAGLDRGHFLSTTGNCNPFDDAATGYCRADAIGTVVLKRLDDALADNDPIFGVIAGSNTNHCGSTVSITRPHDGDQLSLFRRILNQSNTHPLDVSYVEMHGTGTQAGDAAEMRSVLGALAPDHHRSNAHNLRPLHLGAVKACVGHSESASGVTALIKVLLMMQHELIPPQRKSGKLNTNYPADMAKRNVSIAWTGSPWRRSDQANGKRVAMLNNFSAAGGNTALLVEDAPERSEPSLELSDPRTHLNVAVSAKTTQALTDNLRSLIDHIDANPELPLPSLSYTTTARRMHHKFRLAVSGSTVALIRVALQRRLADITKIKAIPAMAPKLVYTFSGQGSFYVGVARELYEHVEYFCQRIAHFDHLVQRHGFPSILPAIKGDAQDSTFRPVMTQLTLSVVQMALSDMWTSWCGGPTAVIGHSLGEYAGLYAANVLSASDTIYLVGQRAQLLEQHCSTGTHRMLVVKVAPEHIRKDVFASDCEIACENSPTNTVVSGTCDSIQTLASRLSAKGLEVIPLDVPYAFHSAQVDPILADFESIASGVTFLPPKVPYFSPLLAQPIKEGGILDAGYLVRAARRCVRFHGAVETARDAGLISPSTVWLEFGAHPTCSGMIRQTLGSASSTTATLRKDTDVWKVMAATLETLYEAGIDVRWSEFHRGFDSDLSVIPLPRYNWDLKNYWIQYRHNFCLTKGDEPVAHPSLEMCLPGGKANGMSKHFSSSIHRIIEQTTTEHHATFLSESDVHDPALSPILSGHRVNGVKLTPSSLYADMALTVARYMLKAAGGWSEGVGLDCGQVHVPRPFILDDSASGQYLRTGAEADWRTGAIRMRFFSVDENGKELAEHATCRVAITRDQKWLEEWQRTAYLITSRIKSLMSEAGEGSVHQLNRGIVYKLFGSLVDYEPAYQGMQKVYLNSDTLESISKVKFQTGENGFEFNPCWIDSLGHVAGFTMNANENTTSKDMVFINHGWDSLRFAVAVDKSKTYTSFNRMQLESGTTYVGNTYVLEDDRIIAIIEGVRFQGIKRAILDRVLPRKTETHRPIVTPSRAAPVAVPRTASKVSLPRALSTPAKPQIDQVQSIVRIVSEEVQIDPQDIEMDAEFTDLGIDSLLSLTIASRLKDELGIQISYTDFMERPTLRSLIAHVGGDDTSGEPSISSYPSTEPVSEEDEPDDVSTDATSISDDEMDATSSLAIVFEVISEETGVGKEDLVPDLKLADIGVDSLLGLTLAGQLSDRLNVSVPANMVADCDSIGELVSSLQNAGFIARTKANVPVVVDNGPSIKDSLVAADPPHATSVVLHRASKTPRKTLFLFPDGAGSAASYLALPSVAQDVAIYGLNCPWLKNPDNLTCSLEAYVAKFLIQIRKIQPRGPYCFGGVSAGGILAYEAAQQLQAVGETVEHLILMDTPDPVGLENPNERMYDFLDKLGMFGLGPGKKAPTWLRPHFNAFLALLDNYHVKPFTGPSPPMAHMFYARDGMCKNENDPRPELRADDPREMLWLINNRTDFSGAGWNSLLGSNRLQIVVLDNVNHYTIMQPGDQMQVLSQGIRKALV